MSDNIYIYIYIIISIYKIPQLCHVRFILIGGVILKAFQALTWNGMP